MLHDDDWKYKRDLREIQKLRDAKPAISVPAPNANVEIFFPWDTDFKNEPSYLETVLGKEVLDVASESEDRQQSEENERDLFLAEVKKLSVRKL